MDVMTFFGPANFTKLHQQTHLEWYCTDPVRLLAAMMACSPVSRRHAGGQSGPSLSRVVQRSRGARSSVRRARARAARLLSVTCVCRFASARLSLSYFSPAKPSNTKWIIIGVVLGTLLLAGVVFALYYVLHVRYAVLFVRSPASSSSSSSFSLSSPLMRLSSSHHRFPRAKWPRATNGRPVLHRWLFGAGRVFDSSLSLLYSSSKIKNTFGGKKKNHISSYLCTFHCKGIKSLL